MNAFGLASLFFQLHIDFVDLYYSSFASLVPQEWPIKLALHAKQFKRKMVDFAWPTKRTWFLAVTLVYELFV